MQTKNNKDKKVPLIIYVYVSSSIFVPLYMILIYTEQIIRQWPPPKKKKNIWKEYIKEININGRTHIFFPCEGIPTCF